MASSKSRATTALPLSETLDFRKDLEVPIGYEIFLGLLELSTISILPLEDAAWRDRAEKPLEFVLSEVGVDDLGDRNRTSLMTDTKVVVS
jgi:hypothetical protein